MKRLLKLAISLALILATVLSLASCSFINNLLGIDDDGDYKADYKEQELTASNVVAAKNTIKEKVTNASFGKFVATYTSDYESTSEYKYNTKYDVTMKVNADAAVGEVFAYIKLKSVYSQPDGNHGRDVTAEYCIVRISDGEYYSDYKVYLNIGGQTYSESYEQMITRIEEADIYLYGGGQNLTMKGALDYQNNQGDYFQMLYAYAEAVTGNEIVSINDNPFIYCLHEFNIISFSSVLDGLDTTSADKGYKLFTAGDNMLKIKRKYDDNKFLEYYDELHYLKINDDGTYSHKCIDNYETKNPARARISKTVKELKPLTGAIEVPTWAK